MAFIAAPFGSDPSRSVRRLWGQEVGVVTIPVSDEEIRSAEITPPQDAGGWPTVAPRTDLLPSALSRLYSQDYLEMSLLTGRDGLKVSLITAAGDEQPFPIAPKDALGFLAAIFGHAPRGVVRTPNAKPAPPILEIRPAPRRHEYRVRLAGVVATPKPVTLPDIGLSPSLLELILEQLENPVGLFLVSGGPTSGRSTTLDLLVATLAARGLKGGRIGGRRSEARPDPTWLSDALFDWPYAESLRAAAPDFLLVERLQGLEELVLAARVAATGCLVLAGAPAAEAEVLARTVSRGLEAGSAPAVPITILSQALVRTVCRGCLGWRPLPLPQAERFGVHHRDVEQMARRGAFAVPAGKGCAECAGTGCAGLTGVFELAGARDHQILPKLREDGWRKALLGHAVYEDVSILPGAHHDLRTLREILVHAGLGSLLPEVPAAMETHGAQTGPVARPARAAEHAAPEGHRPATDDARSLARLLRDTAPGRTVEAVALRRLAARVAERGRADEPLQTLLAPGEGFQLCRHSVNTALIAVRIAAKLGAAKDLDEIALLGLCHDAGLIAAGVDPEADLPPILFEDALDPKRARSDPAGGVASLRSLSKEVPGLVVRIHQLLNPDAEPLPPETRPDHRVQAVALASLVDLHYHGPDAAQLSDLHDVTSLVMEQHGRRFGPTLFRALLRAIPIFPIGALVELSSGDLAQVVSQNEENHFRPRVEITNPVDPHQGSEPRIVDLARAPFLHIRRRVVPESEETVLVAGAGGRA
ncbi:MAG TPA: hypothetical protein VGA64_12860 [Candidatus Polarisedimenticolia bacterium]